MGTLVDRIPEELRKNLRVLGQSSNQTPLDKSEASETTVKLGLPDQTELMTKAETQGGLGQAAVLAPIDDLLQLPHIEKPQTRLKGKLDMVRENLKSFNSDHLPKLLDYTLYLKQLEEDIVGETNPALRDILEQERAATEKYIQALLNAPDVYGTEAVMAYSEQIVRIYGGNRTNQTKKGLTTIIGKLVEAKLIEMSDAGHKFFGIKEAYALTPMFRGSRRAEAIVSSLVEINKQIIDMGHHKDLGMYVLDGQPIISLEDLDEACKTEKPRKCGRIIILVPSKMEGGGNVALEVVAKKIKVLAGSGEIGPKVNEFAESEIFVPAGQVWTEKIRLPHRPQEGEMAKAYKLRELIRSSIQLARELDEEFRKKAEMQAAKEAKWQAARELVQRERETWAPKATLSHTQFYKEEKRVSGFYFLDLGYDPFVQEDNNLRLYDVMALVERDERGFLRVSWNPERLEKYFKPYKEFQNPNGSIFQGLGIFGTFLRAGHKRLQKAKVFPAPVRTTSSISTETETAEKPTQVEEAVTAVTADDTGIPVPESAS